MALVANAGPSGTYADVVETASNGHISLYVVRSGDTLSDIAEMFDVSINTIVWANSLGSAKSIHPGQTLVILPISGVEHSVKKGDTLGSIAKKYKADADEIAEFNSLDAAQGLAVGSVLIVPGGEIVTVTTSSGAKTGSKILNPYRGGGGIETSGYYANPVPGATLTQKVHGWNGVDLGAPTGTPIYAAANGTVIIAKSGGWNGGYGSYVVITHPNGTQTLYSHMSSVKTSVGQGVSQGSIIGSVGRTGQSTGPHLHFEVRGAKNPFASCATGSKCQPK